MRLVATLAAILLAVSACTNSAEPTSTASPKPAITQQTPSAQATPTAAPRNMTFVSMKSIMTSDDNAITVEVDEPFACVREITVTVKGFTPSGVTIREIESADGSYKSSTKVTNNSDGTVVTTLLCIGYQSGGYTLRMSDESSTKWAQVPFGSIA